MIFLKGDSDPEWLLRDEFNERNAELSPDGRWMAYESDESGGWEIYVRPFPDVQDGRWTVSNAGGSWPLWSRDGRGLFYLQPGSPARLMAVAVETEETDPVFRFRSRQVVLDWPYFQWVVGRSYDVSSDGRFLVLVAEGIGDTAESPRINIVQNWFEELKERVPVP